MSILLPLIGGIVIGLAGFALHLFIGRVAGISGILGRLLPPQPGDMDWRLGFILGLVAGGAAMFAIDASQFSVNLAEPSTVRVVIAGLLVGFGTRLGSGCTSGHGVCGLSRLSTRSLVATLVFIVAGATTVALGNLGGAG